jgi:uncharacterized protein YgiM (DUF1202 family)
MGDKTKSNEPKSFIPKNSLQQLQKNSKTTKQQKLLQLQNVRGNQAVLHRFHIERQLLSLKQRLEKLQKIRKESEQMYNKIEQEISSDQLKMEQELKTVDALAFLGITVIGIGKLVTMAAKSAKEVGEELAKSNKEFLLEVAKQFKDKAEYVLSVIFPDNPIIDTVFQLDSPFYWISLGLSHEFPSELLLNWDKPSFWAKLWMEKIKGIEVDKIYPALLKQVSIEKEKALEAIDRNIQKTDEELSEQVMNLIQIDIMYGFQQRPNLEISPKTTTHTGIVTANTLNIRSEPGAGNAVLTSAPQGARVTILETKDGWHRVRLGDRTEGWASAQYIADGAISRGGQHYTTSPGILLKDEPAAHVARIAELYHQKTRKDLVVTSGTRTPARQADALYTKLELGDDVVGLYANKTAIREVKAAYDAGKATGKTKAQIVADMTAILKRQVDAGTSLSAHMRDNAVDFSVRGMTPTDKRAFREALEATGGRVLEETKPPHFHVDLPRTTPPAQGEDSCSRLIEGKSGLN